MAMAVRPPDPPLTDGVVTLRPWGEEGDVEALVDACNDRAIAEFLQSHPLVTSVASAPPEQGGGGVTVVGLKE